MSRLLKAGWVSFGAVALAMASAAPAKADDTVVVTSPTPTVEAATEPAAVWPNPSLLQAGVFTLGASYIPALVVAIESDREEDDYLYAPVVGPWLDLAARDDCDGDDCDSDTLNRVLLVTDGVFQGLGALQILGSFIFPQSQTVTVSRDDGSTAVAFSVTPANFGRGANGLMAVGQF